MLDCLIVGPGGVGGYLAAVLAGGGQTVAVVARGEHGAAIAETGLRLEDPLRADGPPAQVEVAATLSAAPPAEVLVLAVKHPDLPALLDHLPAYLDACPPDALVVALQNGVAHLDGRLGAVCSGRLLAGAVYIFSEVAEPGLIRVVGGPRAYRIGPVGGGVPLAARSQALVASWAGAGLVALAEAEGRQVAWEKLALLAPLSGLTALTGCTVGSLRQVEEAMASFRTIAAEVVAIAAAEGIELPGDLAQRAELGIRATDPEGRSSLWLDLSRGRASELEELLGDPLRRADIAGVAAPALRLLYAATRARYVGVQA